MAQRKFKVGQVVFSLRWLCYGRIERRLTKSFREGWLFDIAMRRGVIGRQTLTVVEKEIRPLTKRECGSSK